MSGYPNPSKILVAVSASAEEDEMRLGISDADRAAVGQAAWLATRCRAELRLLHVVDFVDRRVLDDAPELEQEVIEQLDPQLAALAGGCGVPATHGFRFGVPWREIAREVQETGADLLVISPKRQLTLGERLLFGHTAWRLARHAPSDILVVHPDARPRDTGPGVDKVLALVDRSEVSARVLGAAHMLAELGDAEQHVLTCLDYPNDIAMRQLVHAQKALARYHREEQRKAKAFLDEATAQFGGRWHAHLGEDWVVRHAPKLADELGIDLVVIAAVSKPRLAGMLLGTTAEKLLGRIRASCFMVRPQGWAPDLGGGGDDDRAVK
ncbi:MAG TPA: universal stress protein [Polyangiaceae bacterium]|nr:universal stress protein [Polyangiaceae bacterium]